MQELNQLDEALVSLDKAISLQNDNANLYSQKDFILSELKRYSEAEVAYNRAIQLNPRSAFYTNRGVHYSYQSKPDLALADYSEQLTSILMMLMLTSVGVVFTLSKENQI